MKKKNTDDSIADSVYDRQDTTAFIDPDKPHSLAELGFELPSEGPTKVISIRLPTRLYNRLRAAATDMDMPYQAYMKYLLDEGLQRGIKAKK